MIKKSLIALAIVVWITVGIIPPISMVLDVEDFKLKHTHLLVVGALAGPMSFLSWIIVMFPKWVENNDFILIHKTEKSN